MTEERAIFIARGLYPRNDLFGYDEYMGRGLGRYIPERQTRVIFTDDIGGNFAADYFAENRFLVHYDSLMVRFQN